MKAIITHYVTLYIHTLTIQFYEGGGSKSVS